MIKEPSWRAKVIYIVFAFALVFGLAATVLTALPASAQGFIVPISASPDMVTSEEFDPHFLGTPTSCFELPCCVTFTNLTTGGVLPYSDAVWDFGDGTVVEGEAFNYGETIEHCYAVCGGKYDVMLTMWDADLTEAFQIEMDYITVGQMMPMLSWGTVTLDGAPAPVGTTVDIYVGADATPSGSGTVTTAGLYGAIQVLALSCRYGEALTYTVNGFVANKQGPDAGVFGLANQVVNIAAVSGPQPPTVTTGSATGVTHNSASLNGNLDIGDYATVDVYFEFGTTTAYGSSTTTITKTASGAFSKPISGLTPSTMYHFRAKVDYDSTTSNGGDMTFTTSSADSTEIWISPPAQTVNTGPFTVDVVVDPAVPIAGVQFDLSFDPLLIEAVNVTEGSLLGLSGCSTFFLPGTINNSAGTITGVAGTAIGTGCSVFTLGTFATINFIADNLEGISPLDLFNVKVVDSDANPVPIVVNNGDVEVSLTPWDVNDDDCVDISDLVLVAQHWSETGQNGWIPEDVNDDGVIDISDLVIVAQHWGEGC